MTKAPDAIKRLVERFHEHIDDYKSGAYKEEQVCAEFILPMFEAMGWDVANREGNSEAYKEVIHHDSIKVGVGTRAPDYCFRIGGVRKFFLEAKKPSVYVKEEPAPAFQLRRYAWSAKLPLGIVTDFEEFAVYDCRTRPVRSDKASVARILYLRFDQYLEQWDKIAGVFSKEAILKGSFDKYAEGAKGRRGTAGVDDAFLEEIERWRQLLAQGIAQQNKRLDVRELNFAVQAIIDRIIFLRICEDQGFESYGQLMALQNGPHVYDRLLEIFRHADQRYNSGLFHFAEERGRATPPDTLTPKLRIDDDCLRTIFENLYYPQSPYEFSVIPTEILGQAYERFLGKVIHLTPTRRAKIEEKPEVRKAGGVYYTPSYIVDYIVQNTVGKLLEGKTPKEAAKLRVLDPACGSGSFLIGAYDHLRKWHLDWYVKHQPEKWSKGKAPALFKARKDEWALTFAEQKRILTDNLYGVDIDPQAVEVTKLSLLLKLLEGLTQHEMFRQHALPDLGSNIKCGNSLIGPDFYDKGQMGLFSAEERDRINTFDWNHEFTSIIKCGGFDAIIGNPPYLNIDDTWGKGDLRLRALKEQYPQVYNDKTDILFYFLCKAIQLSKNYVSFIVSRAFLEAYKADKLRGYLISSTTVDEIVDFRNFLVFPGVGIATCIVRFSKLRKMGDLHYYKNIADSLRPLDLNKLISNGEIFQHIQSRRTSISSTPWIFTSDKVAAINNKIDEVGMEIGEMLVIGQGMQTGCNEVFSERSWADISKWRLAKGQYFKRATNSDIHRYHISNRNEYVLYLEDIATFSQLPKGLQKYLSSHSAALKDRAAYKRGNCEWWKFTWPLHKECYVRPKILCPYLATFNRFAVDFNDEFLSLTDTTVIFDNGQPEDMLYLTALLNSRLLSFRFKNIGKLKGNNIIEYFWNSVSKLPVRRINFQSNSDKSKHSSIATCARQMLSLNKQLATRTKLPHDRILLQRQIAATDRQIDQLVYELYGLTKEEIRIVEEGSK